MRTEQRWVYNMDPMPESRGDRPLRTGRGETKATALSCQARQIGRPGSEMNVSPVKIRELFVEIREEMIHVAIVDEPVAVAPAEVVEAAVAASTPMTQQWCHDATGVVAQDAQGHRDMQT